MTTVAELRLRLLRDFGYYAEHALKIRTKDATIAPLVLNEAQKRFAKVLTEQWEAEGKVRLIVLKGRQMGLSTMIGGWLYWRASQVAAQKVFVVAHKGEATATLFEMTKRFHDLCPTVLKPSTKYSGKKELSFDNLQSSYLIQTAGGDGIGRAETLTMVHASEVGFWPVGSARDNWNGLTKAVPNKRGTAIFVESTANGVSGQFYDLWQGAVRGENGFTPVFLPWFLMEEYRDAVPEGFQRSPEEGDLAALYGLDDGQLSFRRREIGLTSRDQFRQEYPCCSEEAFLTSGMPVFNPDQLAAMEREIVRQPGLLLALEDGKFRPNPRGQLREFIAPDLGDTITARPPETYYIGADVALGVQGGDFSVAQVLDSSKRQVAKWSGHVHPDYFADILAALGRRYNDARLIVEVNNHGLLTNTVLVEKHEYQGLYLRTSVDKLTNSERETPGFDTNSKTKPLIIDQLRMAFRKGEVAIYDRNTIAELRTYIVNDHGKMEAESGCHDDDVMSLALANHIHEGKFTPIEVPDSAYFEMI